ncbi:MAG: hypothetical protein HC851_19350 [Acaryochloris sp. RU_4_1]|nr:hypothetical protein [Acaryochloris sp. RU_4_1]
MALVSQQEDYTYLQGLIDQLAIQCQAPRFSPHLNDLMHDRYSYLNA